MERGADLHMSQLPLTVSYFSKIQIGFSFLVRPTRVVPEKGPLNVCVCVCVTVALRSKGCITAATYRITLRITTTCWIFYILCSRPGDAPSESCPFGGWKIWTPQLIHGSLAHPSPYPKWHFDWSVRFYTAHSCVQPTDTKTTLHL